MVDDCVITKNIYILLIRILASYAGYVKHVLASEQKKSDFRPSEGGEADLFSCTQVRLNSKVNFDRYFSLNGLPGQLVKGMG